MPQVLTSTIGVPSQEIWNSLFNLDADLTIGPGGTVVHATATTANRTINLPPASNTPGRILNVVKVDATAFTITVDANGSETINGSLTQVISTQYVSITVQSNNTNWIII